MMTVLNTLDALIAKIPLLFSFFVVLVILHPLFYALGGGGGAVRIFFRAFGRG